MVKKTKRDFLGALMWGVVFLVVVIGLTIKFGIEKAQADEILAKFPDRGVPRMDISLKNTSLDEINDGPKEKKYEGNSLTIYDGGKIVGNYSEVEIKGRGNTTWLQDKKPYQIKLKNKTNLIGMGKAKKWVLLANSLDATHLRGDTAFKLADMVGERYHNTGKYIELYIDGDYHGLYYIVQKVEISKGSVDLRKNNGLLFELDMVHRGETVFYETYFNECLVLKDSVINEPEKLDEIIKMFILDFNKAEEAIEKKDYEKIIEMIDIDSFAQYFLINEFVVNPDAYSTSFYLYRNNDGKISAGPVWDFDLAFSNKEWVWQVDDRLFSPTEEMIKRREAFGLDGLEEDLSISKIFYYLMDILEFKDKVTTLFKRTLSGRKNELTRGIMDQKLYIDMAAKANNDKWNNDEYEAEYAKFIRWVEARYDFMEEKYGQRD